MAKKKQKFKPTEGEVVPDGIPTEFVGPNRQRIVEYLSPTRPPELKSKSVEGSNVERLPSLLSTLDTTETPVSQPIHVEQEGTSFEAKTEKKLDTNSPHIISEKFLSQWAQPFLDVLRQHETSSETADTCSHCAIDGQQALYRCRECLLSPLLCSRCIIDIHQYSPLHIIEQWNGRYFERGTLKDAGYILRLGHHGRACPKRQDGPSSVASETSPVTVIHTTGIQEVLVQYCKCGDPNNLFLEVQRPLQLLKAELWPSSFERIRTVFTLQALRQYHQLTVQAKISAYDYMKTLRRLTNNAFGQDVKDRYREFMRAYRQFTYLRLLKWFGLNVPSGNIEKGSLAVLCPACPQIGINMEPGWEDRPSDEQYLNAIHICADGNFSLSQHDKKMDPLDKAFTEEQAYYANTQEHEKCKARVLANPDLKEDIPACSDFKAGGEHRYSAGKIKSGQVCVGCTRHELVVPTGTVDLDKGEKYVHVDYAMISAISPRWIKLPLIYQSYDIACKYGINWVGRLSVLTEVLGNLDAPWPKTLRLVPVWHENAHTGACRTLNSFRYMPGSGKADGESPERRWSVVIWLARAIREMGLGHRIDILNYHYSDFNIQKVFQMAKTLAKRHIRAVKERKRCVEQLEELEETLLENRAPLQDWKAREAQFCRDIVSEDAHRKKITSPYAAEKDDAPTLQDMLAALQDAPHTTVEQTSKRSHADMSGIADDQNTSPLITDASVGRGMAFLLKAALDLEHEQEYVRSLVAEYNNTSKSATYNKLQEAREILDQTIEEWTVAHAAVMGQALVAAKEQFPAESWPASASEPEAVLLPIPSNLPRSIRNHPALTAFTSAELRVRQGVANDLLRELRSKLALTAFLDKESKDEFGQKKKTRSGKAIADVRTRIRELRDEYNATYKILIVLGEPVDSRNYQELRESDCYASSVYHKERKHDKNESKLSVEKGKEKAKNGVTWIWRDGGTYMSDPSKWELEATRIEWFRFSALTQRWREEVALLEMEMQRTQRFFKHFEDLWDSRSVTSKTGDLTSEGAAAFAARQSAMYARLWKEARELFPVECHV